MSILSNPNLSSYLTQSEDTKIALVEMILPKNSSFIVANRKVDQIFNHSGSNRGELNFEGSETTSNDYLMPSRVESQLELEYTNLLILSINAFIKSLESSTKRSQKNKLNALMIKFISVGIYQLYTELYIPEDYRELIEYYKEYPDQFVDYYKTVINELMMVNENSNYIPKLLEFGNSLLLTEISNIQEVDNVSKVEHDIFLSRRKELREIINPSIIEVRDRLGMKHTTYNENISKVLTELCNILDDEALIDKLKQLVIK